jgi:hypothetical protein
VSGYGPRLQVVRDILADHRPGAKKNCCVTTRRRNLGLLSRLRRELYPLTVRALSLSMPGFYRFVLAMPGLPSGRLPAANLPLALGILTVALVPAPWVILPPAPFAKADPGARPARSGLRSRFSLNVMGAHGRISSQGKSSGRML